MPTQEPCPESRRFGLHLRFSMPPCLYLYLYIYVHCDGIRCQYRQPIYFGSVLRLRLRLRLLPGVIRSGPGRVGLATSELVVSSSIHRSAYPYPYPYPHPHPQPHLGLRPKISSCIFPYFSFGDRFL
ncbi:hypothetical protein M5D96_012122 [Drosophila gunungcola]|uniref:Uncharacterized protein n=1 Tax=Drosophila gunungcola TaxID=103775 RepID=A0A9Q0BKR2_9MUSC|nr:hypothetical protein M5D96_012122 [Drosophila gunungcola]